MGKRLLRELQREADELLTGAVFYTLRESSVVIEP